MADQKNRHVVVRLLSRLASLIWWLLLVVIVLLALYAGLGRQLTQNINDYRANIEQLLSSELGQEVRIGALSSSWNWLNPTIIAREIVVLSDGEGKKAAGSLQSVRIGLDFLASLGRLRIVFANFEADGLKLTVNQTRRGEVMVEGVDIPEPVANDIERWLELAGTWLSDPSVKITRLDLGIRDNNDQVRHVEIPQLDLVYQRGLFHASGRAMRPGTTEQLASFGLVGRHFFRGDFTGQVYADINSGRLFDGLVEEYAWRDVRVEGFNLGGQVWMTFRDGLMEQVSGNVTTPYLQIGSGSQSLAPLEDIRASFGWRRREASGESHSAAADQPWFTAGEFHLKGLEWQWNGEAVPPFSVRFQHDEKGPRIIADGLPLQPLRRLVAGVGVLPESATRALENHRPSGRLNQLMLKLPPEGSRDFQLTALLQDLEFRAFGGVPGISGVDGKLVVDNEGGYVDVQNEELTLGLPNLFPEPWDLQDVGATVAWRLDGDIIRVFSDDIHLTYGAGTDVTGAFDLRLDRQGENNLGLKVGIKDGRADMLGEFVPVKALGPRLSEWLNTAISKADIVSGEYYGHGVIGRGAPPGSFVSSMVFSFRDAAIRYDERWPEVTDVSGTVHVHNRRARVDVESGRTGGLDLQPGQVIVDPGDDGVRVYVDAAAPVPGDAVAYWMDNSPLGEMAGVAGRSIRLDGSYHLELDLGLPLGSDSLADISATVRADEGTLTYLPADLQWTQINGELTYSTEDGFSDEPLRGRFLGAPVTVRLRRSGVDDALTIRQSGRLDIRNLLAQTALGEGTSLGLSGEFGYQATLNISPDEASAVKLYSDLSGLAVSWPEPLAKSTEQKAPLSATITPRGEAVNVSVDWPDRLNLELLWQAGNLELDIDRVFLGDQQLTDIEVSARQENGEWSVDAESEWLSGVVYWPADDSPVVVDIERLKLARGEGRVEDEIPPLPEPEEQVRAFRELAMGNWPDVDLRIASLQLGGDDAGSWSLWLRPEATRLRVEDISGTLKSLELDGELTWSIAGDRESTRFVGDITGDSLADMGNLFGTQIPFRSESTAINMDIDWPGRPNDFDLSGLSGSVRVRFDDGVILEGNSTAQLFRVFNLLNSDTLWRRLQLDFSDLYEAGVAFDAISGKASIINGLLTLDPELQVVGPSGAFKLTGTSNMIEETLDMQMVVVLPLTQNLPLAALLMGAGAPIGGALFVLDKVLGDPLSKLTSATYSVTGNWDEPDVRLRRVFDTGQ
ncbi:YhdP family phospholipid transporter [Marinobacter orientalis]|uniref:YhdP family phospholipid transporter n=1 Tax=Marinobacter orientalis TaxID=1928859 RepID=UPI001D18057C|nr:AsmA-like C-terminal region-containing protein [Marinobacter orientalis]